MINSRNTLVFIVGKTCSGKTSVARCIGESGYFVVSASHVLAGVSRSMGYDFLDRVDLSNFAVKLRASNELNLFHNALFASLKKSVSGVVDGARFVETYDNAKTIYLRPIVVYLDCDEAVRKGRFERLNSKLSWDQVTSLETERSVHDFRQVCSLCIRTNNITPQKVAGQIMDLFFVS